MLSGVSVVMYRSTAIYIYIYICILTIGDGAVVGCLIEPIFGKRIGNARVFGLEETVIDGIKEPLSHCQLASLPGLLVHLPAQ